MEGPTTKYPNQLGAIRRLRGLRQIDIARCLGHADATGYQAIERGRRFPRGQTLALILTVLHCELKDAYPHLVWEAQERVSRQRSSYSDPPAFI